MGGVGEKNLTSGSLATLHPKQTIFLSILLYTFIFQLYFKYEVFYPEGRAAARGS